MANRGSHLNLPRSGLETFVPGGSVVTPKPLPSPPLTFNASPPLLRRCVWRAPNPHTSLFPELPGNSCSLPISTCSLETQPPFSVGETPQPRQAQQPLRASQCPRRNSEPAPLCPWGNGMLEKSLNRQQL